MIGGVLIAVIAAFGFALSRDTWERSGPPIRVASWAPYWQPDTALASFVANSEMFADVSVVAFSARDAATIVAFEQLESDMIANYRAATTASGTPLIATVFDDSPKGTMSAAFADPAARTRHVRALVALATTGGGDGLGFDGLDLDYENFAFVDGRDSWATTRPNWIAFLAELSAALRPTEKQLIVSVPPVYDGGQTDASGYWVYDYAAMADHVDRIRVMAYDYSVLSGEPGPIAPVDWVEQLVGAVSELVPPAKIDLGIPTYGYDWVVSVAGVCPVEQEPSSRAMSTVRAARTVAERAITPVWDEATAEQMFDYTDTLTGPDAAGVGTTCTVQRTVRYLDARAVHRRAVIAHRNDLHGVALWALGNDDALTWDALRAARRGEETWG